MTPPTVIRRGLPRARDPERDHPLRSAPEIRDHVDASPRRPVLSVEHDTALLPNVAAPGEPVAFPPVTDTDWRTLTIRDAEGSVGEDVTAYLRDPKNVRRWHVFVKGLLNEIDCGLGEHKKTLRELDDALFRGASLSPDDRAAQRSATTWIARAKRLLAALRTRGTETSQAIRQLDEAVHFGGARQRKAEQLLAWAASVVPREGEGAAWHAAMVEHWRAALPVAGDVANSGGPG